jgi:hypothetical protein
MIVNGCKRLYTDNSLEQQPKVLVKSWIGPEAAIDQKRREEEKTLLIEGAVRTKCKRKQRMQKCGSMNRSQGKCSGIPRRKSIKSMQEPVKLPAQYPLPYTQF